jgi:hypothetical protein
MKPVSLAMRDDGLLGINLAYVGMTAGNLSDLLMRCESR